MNMNFKFTSGEELRPPCPITKRGSMMEVKNSSFKMALWMTLMGFDLV